MFFRFITLPSAALQFSHLAVAKRVKRDWGWEKGSGNGGSACQFHNLRRSSSGISTTSTWLHGVVVVIVVDVAGKCKCQLKLILSDRKTTGLSGGRGCGEWGSRMLRRLTLEENPFKDLEAAVAAAEVNRHPHLANISSALLITIIVVKPPAHPSTHSPGGTSADSWLFALHAPRSSSRCSCCSCSSGSLSSTSSCSSSSFFSGSNSTWLDSVSLVDQSEFAQVSSCALHFFAFFFLWHKSEKHLNIKAAAWMYRKEQAAQAGGRLPGHFII